jgi:diamine N-acetyltransferase
MIELRDVTTENLDAIVALSEGVEERLVAPNSLSIVEWLLRDDGWLQAIYADRTPVGLVMLQDIPDWNVYHVWRLMIGNAFQRRGYGRAAMERVIDRYKRRPGAHAITTFVADTEGDAETFYRKLGFERDGREQMGQIGLQLKWAEPLEGDAWSTVPEDAEFTLEPVRSGYVRTIRRAYLSVPESEREGLDSPWTIIAHSKLDPSADRIEAICANGYPIGYVVKDPSGSRILATCIAAPYQGRGIEESLD